MQTLLAIFDIDPDAGKKPVEAREITGRHCTSRTIQD
jgi:hypothetical protein